MAVQSPEADSARRASKVVIRGLLAYTASHAGLRALKLVSLLIAARLLTMHEFGILSSVMSLVAVVGFLGLLGSDNVAMRYGAQAISGGRRGWLRFLAFIFVPIFVAVPAITATIYALFGGQFESRGLSGGLMITSGATAVVFGLRWSFAYMFRGIGATTYAAIIDISYPVVFVVGMGIVALSGEGALHGILGAYAASHAIPAVIAAVLTARLRRTYIARARETSLRHGGRAIRLRPLLSFGLTTMVGRGAALARTEADKLILLYFASPATVAGYNVAARGARQLNMFGSAFSEALAPYLVGSHARERGGLEIGRKQADAVFWVAGPLILLAFLVAPFFLHLFGGSYVAFLPIFAILALIEYSNVALGPVEMHLRMQGAHRAEAYLMMASSAVMIGLAIVLVPLFAAHGMAVAVVVGMTVFKAGALAVAARGLLMLFPPRRIWRLAPAVGAVAAIWGGWHTIVGITVVAACLGLVAMAEGQTLRAIWSYVRRESE